MSVTSFDSKEYAWIDVQVFLLGKLVTGLRGIEYKMKRQKEALFATGRKARGIQMGKKEYDGTITVLQSEFIALNAAAKAQGYDDITDVEFDFIVSYIPDTGIVQTDKVLNASITEAPSAMKEGDLYQEIALPFIACDIEPNVV
ncbi:MAG: hypothetical protein SNG79_01390 [Rikenellaceae bacterium]